MPLLLRLVLCSGQMLGFRSSTSPVLGPPRTAPDTHQHKPKRRHPSATTDAGVPHFAGRHRRALPSALDRLEL